MKVGYKVIRRNKKSQKSQNSNEEENISRTAKAHLIIASCGFLATVTFNNKSRWKTRGRGTGSRGTGYGVPGSRGVENAGCGKRGV